MPLNGNAVIEKFRKRFGDTGRGPALDLLNESAVEIFSSIPYRRRELTLSLTAGVGEYSFPASYAKAWTVRYLRSGTDGDYRELDPTSTDELDFDRPGWRGMTDNEPVCFYLSGSDTGNEGTIGVWPAPNLTTNATTLYTFTVLAANANSGAVYSNNGQNFTVVASIAGGLSLATSGTGPPVAAGVLTLVSGIGDLAITFSVVAATPNPGVGYPVLAVDASVIPFFTDGSEMLPDIPFVIEAMADMMCFKRAKDVKLSQAADWAQVSALSIQNLAAVFWGRNPRKPQEITPGIQQRKAWTGNRGTARGYQPGRW